MAYNLGYYNFNEKYLKIFRLLFKNITIEQTKEIEQEFEKGKKLGQKSIKQQEQIKLYQKQIEEQKQLELQQKEEKEEFFNFISSFKYGENQILFNGYNTVNDFLFTLGYYYNVYKDLIEQKEIDYIYNGFYKYYQNIDIETLKQKFKEGQEKYNIDTKKQEKQQQKAERDFKSYAESKGLYNIYEENEQKQAGTGYINFFVNLGYNYINTTEEEFERVCGYLEKFDSNFNKELAETNFESGKKQKAKQNFKSYAESKIIGDTNLYNIYTENEQEQARTGYTNFFVNLGYKYIDTTKEEFERVCGYLEKFDVNFNKDKAIQQFNYGKQRKAELQQTQIQQLQQSTTYQPMLHNGMQQTMHYNYQPQQQNTQILNSGIQSQNIMYQPQPQQFTGHQQVKQMKQDYDLYNQQFGNVQGRLQNYSMGMSLDQFSNGNYQGSFYEKN